MLNNREDELVVTRDVLKRELDLKLVLVKDPGYRWI